MLRSIQSTFYKAIFNKRINIDFISSSYKLERFDVYRQTIFENMRNSLRVTFPGIWKLLGEKCANSAANTFYTNQKNLPFSGCLDDFGESFPEFLKNSKQLSELPYLKDYAYYEWLKHKSYIAKEMKPITYSELQHIPEDQIDYIILSFVQSLFLFSSNYNIHNIQEIIENPNAKKINLEFTRTYAVIVRIDNEVLTFWISGSLWHFINLLKHNIEIAEASRKIKKKYNNFNLTEAICFLLEKKLIHRINR